jgi:hypothetical protein
MPTQVAGPPVVYAAPAIYATPAIYAAPPIPKSKTTAVLLAVFFGFWTWAYTYKRDAAFFWINLVASFVTAGAWWVLIAWPWAIICAAVRPSEFYTNYPSRR